MAMAENESVSRSLISLTELPESGVVAVEAEIDGENESIVVCRSGAALAAYLNICPHAGRRLDYAPGKFLIDDGNLVCAAHGATFRIRDGLCVAGPCRGQSLKALAVQVRDDGLLVIKSVAAD